MHEALVLVLITSKTKQATEGEECPHRNPHFTDEGHKPLNVRGRNETLMKRAVLSWPLPSLLETELSDVESLGYVSSKADTGFSALLSQVLPCCSRLSWREHFVKFYGIPDFCPSGASSLSLLPLTTGTKLSLRIMPSSH